MRFIWLAVLIVVSLLAASVGPLLGGEFQSLAAGIFALNSGRPSPTPGPAPNPPLPAGICENCRGTGKLGDGTISVTCPVCKGTGKKVTAAAAPVRLAYPLRSGWWSGCGSWRHLLSGEHAGKFDPAWLQTLNWNELQSLHSDDHDRAVKWSYVQRPIARRAGGHYRWSCDGRSCGWKWIATEKTD